jgi:hypothetical protein
VTAVAEPPVAERAAEAERAPDEPARSPAPNAAVEPSPTRQRDPPAPGEAPVDGPSPASLLVARELVRALAPLLGVDPRGVRIVPGPTAAWPGVIAIGLAPLPKRPLVVHELAHVAQHANRARPRAVADPTAAEAEASALAVAARYGSQLWRPRAVLPAGRVAREADASGITPAPPAPDAAALAGELDELVKTTRIAELARINDAASAIFTLTSAAVETLLQVLDTMDFVTARAVVHALEPKVRVRLAHLDDDLHRRYPGAAAAVLAGLAPADVARFAAESQPQAGGPPGLSLRQALHGITAERLTPTQLRGLLDAMRSVPQSILVELERGDRREDFRALLGAPAPPGTDADELDEAVKRERTAAKAANDQLAKSVVERLRPVLASSNEASAQTALDMLAPLAEATVAKPAAPVEPAAPPAPAPAPAAEAAAAPAAPAAPVAPPAAAPTKTGTNAPPTPTERLRAIAEALDAEGMVDRILDGLSSEERYAGPRSDTLKLVLAARAPALTLPRIESLLSYGLFDWAVTDADARFAYFLLRTLPLEVQDAWRLRDEGKWFQRLEDNVPEELITSGEYTGVGSEYRAGPQPESAADAKKAADRFESMLRDWRAEKDEANAKYIARLLLGIHPDTAEPLAGSAHDLNVRIGTVRRLDTAGALEEIYGELPERYLLDESTRHEVMDLTLMRDPVHVEQHAAKLLKTGLFDWWISSREAWLAYQLLRTLPPATQQRFQAADPGRWTSMMNAMTPEMRASLATGAATGRGPFPGREALRERLRDPELWTADHVNELRALMDLARATDDAQFVFDESKRRRAFEKPWLLPLVDALHLYDERPEVKRLTFQGEGLEERGVGFELLRFVDDLTSIRWILVGLGSWLIMDWVSIGGKSIVVKDFDLSWAQWAMGGDFAGARLADKPPAQPAPPPTPAAKTAGAPAAPTPGPNRLSMEVDVGTGAVRVRLPELALQSVNIVRAGASYRTGPLVLRNLRVQGDFSDRHYREPVGVELDADRLDVDDMVLADARLPTGAWGLAHLMTQPLHLKGGAKGDEDLKAHPPREGAIPIPVFGPILEALSNIVAIKGGIPFDYTLVDFALMPLTSGMNVFASSAISIPANALIKSPAPLDYLWGLATDGTLRPPRTVAERAKDAMAMLRSFEVSFDELTISGLSIGAGEQVSSITLRDVDIGVGQSRPAYLRLLIKSLQRARTAMAEGSPDRTAIDTRIADLERELYVGTEEKPSLAAAEEELEKLERKDRWIHGSLSEWERKRLAELSDLVRRDTGAIVDIGAIEVGALTGKVAAAGVKVGGIHLEGRVPLNTAGYLADEDLAARFAAGGPKAPTVAELAKGADVRLTIASAEVVRGPGGEPALRIAADRVPTEQELMDRLAGMAPDVDPALRARVQEALDAVREMERLRATDEKGEKPDVQDKIASQARLAREKLGLEIGSVTLGPVDGGLDPKTGALTATVHNLDVNAIKGDGWAVRRVHGDLQLGVKGVAGLNMDYRSVTGADARKALTGHFGIDATAEGITTEYGGAGAVTIAGLHGDVRMLDDGFRVSDVWATRIAVNDVNFGAGGTRVTATGVTLEGLGLDAEIHTRSVGGETEVASATASRLDVNRITADHIVYDAAKTDDGGTLHVEITSGALGGIRARNLEFAKDAEGNRHLSGKATVALVDQIQYRVVLGSLDSASKELKETTIAGTAQGPTDVATGKAAAGAEPVINAQFASGPDGTSFSLGLKDLELLGTEVTTPDGNVVVRHVSVSGTLEDTEKGLTARATLTDVDIGHVDWHAGTARITGDGVIKVKRADVAGRLAQPDPTATDPQKRSGGLWVDDLDIHELDADSLHYLDPPIDVKLSRFPDPHPGALHAKRIRLQNFFRPYEKDVLGKPTAGHVDVTDAHADFAGTVAKGISVSGGIDAKSITVDIFDQDRLVLRAQGVGGDVDVDLDGDTAHAVLSNFDTGVVTVTPEAILIGGPGKPGLHFDMLHIDELSAGSATGDHPFTLLLLDRGSIDVINVDMSARIERWLPDEKHDADQPFKRVVVDRFEIGRIEAEGIWLQLPKDGVLIRIPEAAEYKGTDPLPPRAFIRHVVLAGPEKGKSFEWVPGKKGYKSGKVSLDEISVPKLEAEVTGRFHGSLDLHTDTGSIGFMQNGDTVVDISHPRARMSDPAWLDNPDRKLIVEEIGAEKAHIDLLKGKPAKVTVTEAHLDRLKFEQPGVLVETRKITLPGDVTATATEGTIPELKIEDAHIHIDFLKLPASSGSSGGGMPLDRDSIERLLDSLQGDLSLVVFFKVSLPVLDPRDIRIPVSLHFTDGRIDYSKLEASLQGRIGAKVAGEPDSTSYLVEALTSRPEFWMERNEDLVFGLHITDISTDPEGFSGETTPIVYEIVRWTLATDEIKPASQDHLLRIGRILHEALGPSTGGGGSSAIDARTIELQDIDADLSIRSKDPIPLNLTTSSATGTITMSPNAVVGLKAGGFIPASVRPAARSALPGAGGLKPISLDEVNFDKVDLMIGGTTQVTTGSIQIKDLKDGTFDIDALYPPHPLTFDARITSAVAHDIHWDLAPKKK